MKVKRLIVGGIVAMALAVAVGCAVPGDIMDGVCAALGPENPLYFVLLCGTGA